MVIELTSKIKHYEFLRHISLFGGCCTLKGFEYFHAYSNRHAKREISKYLKFGALDTVKFSENEYLRSVGIGNIYVPENRISKMFKVNRKIPNDPEKILIKNLRFLTASYLIKCGDNPVSMYDKDEYFKIVSIDQSNNFYRYIVNSNMDDPITKKYICICLVTIWSKRKCLNIIIFWINLIKDFKLELKLKIFSISKAFNDEIRILLNFEYNVNLIEYNIINIDNFEEKYTNFLINREIKFRENELILGNMLED